jgi:hypothetical protein
VMLGMGGLSGSGVGALRAFKPEWSTQDSRLS